MPEILSNEYQLLLACARRSLTQQDIAKVHSLIAAGIDLNLACRSAERHGLFPLLVHHLQGNFPETIPNLEEQKQRFLRDTVHKLFWSRSLVRLLQALEAAGIRALAYKGPALATVLYGDIALREVSDLDILIDPGSFSAAREVLIGLGYQPPFPQTHKQEQACLHSDCELLFHSSDSDVTVDLHWAITPPHLAPRLSFDELWRRRRVVSLGKPVPTFSAEDTTLLLAIHGGKHLWQRLCWLADFAESQRQNLNWHVLQQRARNARAERMLWLGLVVTNRIFGMPLPSELKPEIDHNATVQRISENVAKTLFDDGNEGESDRVRWFTMVHLTDTRWEGLRCGARFALASGPREWQAVRLPDSLFGLYTLLRLATVLRAAFSLLFERRSPGWG